MKEIVNDIHSELIKQLGNFGGYKPIIHGETIVITAHGEVGRSGKITYPAKIRSGVNVWGDTQYRPQLTPNKFFALVKEAVKIVEAELAIKIKVIPVKEVFKQGNRHCINCVAKFELNTKVLRS